MNELGNSKTRVFLIEDNPGDARLIRDLLAEAGNSLLDLGHADCLLMGLKRLAEGDIDVLLLDLSLPDSQGLDSLSKVLSKTPKVPIVVMSGLEDESVAIKAVQEGAQDYLVKGSVDAKLLARSLRYAIERHRLQEALRQREAGYRLLADNVKDIIWARDMNLHTTYVSPSVTEMSGYSVEEVVSLSLEESMTPASLELVRTALAKVLAAEGKGRNDLSEAVVLELELIRKDGSIVPVEMKVNLLRDDDGRPTGFLGVTRDITERKRLEEQLRLADRLAAVGELATGVTHELNNPLTAIRGLAQLLTARGDLDETMKKDLETINKEAQRASKIVGNLLSFGRRHEPEKRVISMNEVVEKTLELRAHQLKVNNIEVSVELQPDLPMTMADFHQIQQVFVNIINNAEQAMTEAHGRGKLIVKTERSGEMVRIVFTDSGPGIPEKNLNRIFDPFFTTKEVGKGTGLGLSICYGIVEAHGGHIYARSTLGRGATFTVEIPMACDGKPIC